jgi:XRE family transcriptional regulator, aerobic/anaerobic benzoate catabolism transcriptional regulator
VAELSPEEAVYLKAIGDRARTARDAAGLTRSALAEKSGISLRYLALLEAGEGNLSVLMVRRLCAALGLAIEGLLAPVDQSRRAHIALVGLRGAGKSTLGRQLAERLAVPFIELDQEVERALGTSLANVFALYGEATFRQAEFKALQSVIQRLPKAVIATGGSIVEEANTYAYLREHCFSVWLSATPRDHMQRVVDQGDMRPIKGRENAMQELENILKAREKAYVLADKRIDTSATNEEDTLELLVAAVSG